MSRTVHQFYCVDCGLVFHIKKTCRKNPKCPCCKSENTKYEGSSLKLYLTNKKAVAKK